MLRKGRGKGSKKGQDRPEMWNAVARLTLQSAIQHRCWEAAMLQTLLIPSESPVLKAMREAGQQNHGEVQAADAQRKRDLGPPHIHVFAAFLRVARDCLAHLTPLQDTVQALTATGRNWDMSREK